MDAPPDATLTVGLTWIEKKGWRVMMIVHNAMLHLGSKEARGLADIYDKHHASPEWRGTISGLEWVAPQLRVLSDEVDQKNAAREMPPQMLNHVQMQGRA